MNTRFRRLTDLFVKGKTLELPDGSALWIQVLNPFERDECLSDAQVARARLVMALKDDSSERLKVEARFAERGRDALINELAAAKIDEKSSDMIGDIRDHPDWRERMDILLRSDFSQSAKSATEQETLLMAKINMEFFAELQKRQEDEREALVHEYTSMGQEQFVDVYMCAFLDRRGGELASAEYGFTEMWYATRYCNATKNQDGEWDHTECDGHVARVFEEKSDVRSAPGALQELLSTEIQSLAMDVQDPKDLGNAENSSELSPPPSEEGESTVSTSTETPHELPGTSQ